MIRNIVYGTYPIMAHAPGKIEYIPLWKQMHDYVNYNYLNTSLPENVTLVTFNNNGVGYNDKPLGLLEKYLDKLNVKYFVLGRGITSWQNRVKIYLLREFLDKITTQYLLVADSSDVFIINKLERIISDFEKIGCEALFNAEKKFSPHHVPEFIKEFELSFGYDSYLNAGLWMSKTNFARELLDYCCNIESEAKSEQYFYKFGYFKFYPKVVVDYRHHLFQGLNRMNSELEFTKIF